MRKTKIICTLGPASTEPEIVRQMAKAGMNVARFNFSHGSYEDHLQRFRTVEQVRSELELPIATMLDTKGPEVRLGTFAGGRVTLQVGERFTLTPRQVDGTPQLASISYEKLAEDVDIGTVILIDDGLIELRVVEIRGADIVCEVLNGGEISDRKGVNIPSVHLNIPFISEKDRSDILFGIRTGFDFIAASFVRTAEDILAIRAILEEEHCTTVKIIAKIENAEGVENIDDILRVADGIMVARGDMGVEIPLEDVPVYQKRLIRKAYQAGKHVITATQMLESMMKNPRPTRAEANDIANAIYDGTSAIMLSGESAAGRYPVEAVKTMAVIAERTERDVDYRGRFYKHSYAAQDVTNAISYATCSTAYDVCAAAIISVTQSGHTARMCSRFRPNTPIIACTTSYHIYRQLSLSWGVYPIIMPLEQNTDELFEAAVNVAQKAGYVQPGDLAVITAGVPLGVPGTTNLLKVSVVGDVLVQGTGVGDAQTVGNLCVAKNEEEALLNFKQNDILVIPEVTDAVSALLSKASGIITESANMDFAAAGSIRRGIPILVGAAHATTILKSGISVGVNAAQGLVYNAALLKHRKR